MPASATEFDAYKKVNVETASQGKLIVMLFNGAIQRAEEAKRQIASKRPEGVHKNLVRAQDIVAELRSSLNMEMGEVARNLDRIYEYAQHLLIKANIRKETGPVDECIAHLIELRDMWEASFEKAAKEGESIPTPPKMNPGGSSALNIKG